MDTLLERIANFIPILLSLTVHEWAHAWTAWKLGDDTAKSLGRVSLNPIDHIDPVGTLLLPLMGVPFGWAKPVPVNPLRFRQSISMSMGMLIVAAAGPLSNLVLALFGGFAFWGFLQLARAALLGGMSPEMILAIAQILAQFVVINVLLACFNLLPIPPLDGSKIVDALVPNSLRPMWQQFMSLGPILLIAVILLPSLMGFSLMAWPAQGVRNVLEWLAS